MSLKLTLQEFINRSKAVHGKKYDYSLSKYTSNRNPLTIICPVHGKFKQRPSIHFSGGECNRCADVKRSKTRSLKNEQWVERAKSIHGEKYDYSQTEYKTSKHKVKIICSVHGEFMQSPFSHTGGCGCYKCADKIRANKRRYTTEGIVEIFKSKKQDKDYSYNNVKYKDYHTKVLVTCNKHGDFPVAPSLFIKGTNCPNCFKELRLNNYIKEDWAKRGNGRVGKLYLLKCWNEEELFYKIGITFDTLKSRYGRKHSMPYNYECIATEENLDLIYIYEKELEYKALIRLNHYLPKIPFSGSLTECFNSVDLLETIKFKNIFYKSLAK